MQDGWILESSENSNVGGILNSATQTFNLGDDAARKQYRSILSFNTGVTLRIMKQTIVGGGNPVNMFQGFMADVENGFFGSAAALQTSDFQATASQSSGPFVLASVSGWYSW